MSNLNNATTSFQPWQQIWLRPRACIEFLQQQVWSWPLLWPAWLVGIVGVLESTLLPVPEILSQPQPITFPWPMALVLGPLLGWLQVLLLSSGLWLIVRLSYGLRADWRTVQLCVIWSLLPQALGLPLLLLQLMFFDGPLPASATAWHAGHWLLQGTRIVLSFYCLTLLAMTLSEALKLPLKRTFNVVFLLCLVFIVLLLLIAAG